MLDDDARRRLGRTIRAACGTRHWGLHNDGHRRLVLRFLALRVPAELERLSCSARSAHPLPAGALRGPPSRTATRVPRDRAASAFTYRFALWQARRLGIPFKMPPEHPFNPLPLLRSRSPAIASADAVQRSSRFVWRDGPPARPPDRMGRTRHDLPAPERRAAHRRARRQGNLRPNTDEAIARGDVRRATLAIGDELLLGQRDADGRRFHRGRAMDRSGYQRVGGCRWGRRGGRLKVREAEKR